MRLYFGGRNTTADGEVKMGFPRYFWYNFLVPGLPLLGWGGFDCYRVWNVQRFVAHTRGTVVRTTVTGPMGLDFHAEIAFVTPDGRSHTFDSTMGSVNALKAGRKVAFVFDIDDPDHARVELGDRKPWAGPIILGVWGGIFSLLGGIPIAFRARKAKLADWLKLNGQAVQADFTGVHLNTDLVVNEKSPDRVTAQWKEHRFHCENLWTDPSPHITSKVISVVIDPTDPTRYWMDLSFLPRA